MIAIRLQGRLGNQLFQYAFIYSTAKKIKSGFYLDQYFEESFVHKYFQIDAGITEAFSLFLFDISGYKNFFNFHFRKSLNKFIVYIYKLKPKEYEFAVDESTVVFEDNTLYIGYFQSLFFMV